MAVKIPIVNIDEPLHVGDVVELHFKASGPTWFKATQVAVVERALENREGYEIISSNYLEPQKVIFTLKVTKTNPVVVTVALIAGAIALPAIAFGWMFKQAYKVVGTPEGMIAGFAIIAIAALILILRK